MSSLPKTSRQLRKWIFLKDIAWLACCAFGGSQAHVPIFLKKLVDERKYLTSKEFLDLQALCQCLPGPTSTQTLVAIAHKRGGAHLAYLTLLIWCLPVLLAMIGLALGVHYLSLVVAEEKIKQFTRFIQPMAVAFIAYAAIRIWQHVINNTFTASIALVTVPFAFFFRLTLSFAYILVARRYSHVYLLQKVSAREKAAILCAVGQFLALGNGLCDNSGSR